MRNERAEIGMRKAESKAASIEQRAEDRGEKLKAQGSKLIVQTWLNSLLVEWLIR
jgi:hypothetical protein